MPNVNLTKIFGVPSFKKARKVATLRPPKPKTTPDIPDKEVLPTDIQGSTPGSTEEARTSLALDQLGYSYAYQYSIWGGRRLRGGQVIDFLVYTKPHPTPLLYNGDYWHTGQHADPFDTQKLNVAFRGRWMPAVVLWQSVASTTDQVKSFLRANLPSP